MKIINRNVMIGEPKIERMYFAGGVPFDLLELGKAFWGGAHDSYNPSHADTGSGEPMLIFAKALMA